MQLIYHGYCNSTGYSISAQDYILSIEQQNSGLDIKFNPINMTSVSIGISPNRQQIFAKLRKKRSQENIINLYHSIPDRYKQPKAIKNIGFCVFETINPPNRWIEILNKMDQVITASTFNKRIFETSGVKVPIAVIPHCFDTKLFHKNVQHHGRYELFTFLAIGTWKNRKNWEYLIKAFYDAFEKKDGVCLLIKTNRIDLLRQMVERVKRTCEWRSKDTAPIYTEDHVNCTFEEIPSIMKKSDVYISASLGEGFCLPGLQAMALEIPVITTKFGGVLEYAKPEYVTYIEPKHYKTVQPRMDGIPQFEGCIWPVIRTKDIRDKMRYVKDNYPEVKKKAELSYHFIHNNFSYDVVGKKLLEVIIQAPLPQGEGIAQSTSKSDKHKIRNIFKGRSK